MNIPTEEEIFEASKRFSFRFPESCPSVVFIKGCNFVIDRIKPKPHIAEVVKCGQVNKSKYQLQQEAYKVIGTKIHKDFAKTLIVGTPGEMSTLEIKLTKEMFEHPASEFIDLLISHGKISMDKEKIEQSKTCEHTNGPEVFSTGYVCTKCSQWINYTND